MIPEPLRLELGLIKKKCDPVLRIAIEGLEEIANRYRAEHGPTAYYEDTAEQITSDAHDVLEDIVRAWRVEGQTKTPYA